MTDMQSPVMGACRHCRAPTAGDSHFCCVGCEAVWSALHERGLEGWYRLREQDRHALHGVPARPGGEGRHGYLDTDRYRDDRCRKLTWREGDEEAAGFETTWMVRGMTCVACAWLIEQLGQRSEGIVEVNVDPIERRLRLRATDSAKLAPLADEMATFGYGVGLPEDNDDGAERRRDLAELAIAGALAANTMLLTLPYYFGLNAGPLAALFGAVSGLLATLCLLSPARPFLRLAVVGLRRGIIGLDVPIALGIVAAWGWSMGQLLLGHWHLLYFDSLVVLVFALRLGRFAQARAIDRAAARARLLAAAMPQLVRTWRDGRWRELPPEGVAVGERIQLEAGEELPFACQLVGPPADFDLRVVSGESRPQQVSAGGDVVAGARPLTAVMLARAEARTEAARRDPLAGLDSDAVSRSPTGVDRLGKVFTLVVLAVAAACAVGWLWADGPERALEVAVTVLIVACPCALGLATPVTVAMVVAGVARAGVLVRRAEVLETLATVRAVAFDKTGTVTEGRPTVVATHLEEGEDWPAVAGALARVEATSRHPLAGALVDALVEPGQAAPTPPDRVEVLPGAGICGVADGWQVVALAARAAEERGLRMPAEAVVALAGMREQGYSLVTVWAAADTEPGTEMETDTLPGVEIPHPSGRFAKLRLDTDSPLRLYAIFGINDQLRPDAAATLIGLRGRHAITPSLISGDHRQAVDLVADALAIADRLAEADPDTKAARVARLAQSGPVVMVGDGHNDIAALRAADVAVAVGSATPAAIAASHVVLPVNGVGGLLHLFDVARQARRAIAIAMTFALLYNGVALALAAAGAITPLLAAILMPISSLTVVGWAVFAGEMATSRPVQTEMTEDKRV